MKTLTVNGIGNLSVSADYIEISLTLSAVDPDYTEAMRQANEKNAQLKDSLEKAGHEKSALKTINFNVDTAYKSETDKNGKYVRVFEGYRVTHQLKIEFDFDMQKLNATIIAIAECSSNPEFSIEFTVKDKNAVNKELLKHAVKNATQKAKTLAAAADVKLGDIVSIDYSFGDKHMYSPTRYAQDSHVLKACKMSAPDIEPDDIEVSDTVTVVWEISK